MLNLRYKTETYDPALNGIKKVVTCPEDYLSDDYILFVTNVHAETGHADNILTTSGEYHKNNRESKRIYHLDHIENIENNAVVRIENGSLYITYRPSANQHAIFMTKRCNHYCLMCSEPPSTQNDSFMVEENLKLIELMDKGLPVIGITGGEPTLEKENFIRIINKIREEHPDTVIRLLTNGRSYQDETFVEALSEIASEHLISEIPIYDTDTANHDYIVQARNAFNETVEGMYNCFKHDMVTEVRIVLTKQNYKSLSNIVHYIYKNMPFVAHIAFMGMEYIGFAINNFDKLHINPNEYKEELYKAINLCERYNLQSSIYNLPLCMIDPSLWHFSRQSISDWKNEFDDKCEQCGKRDACAGMFSSTYPFYREFVSPLPTQLADADCI